MIVLPRFGNHYRDRDEATPCPLPATAGITILELVVVIAVLGIILTIAVPRYTCMMQKSRMASRVDDLRQARDAIEIYQVELGSFPPDLQAAFGNRQPPDLEYCVDTPDGNSGHGNQFCTFFDPDNPSAPAPQGSALGVGYILRTRPNLAPCAGVDFVWTTCCGREPDTVHFDENGQPPGHPGQ